jgi:hypothetical protein
MAWLILASGPTLMPLFLLQLLALLGGQPIVVVAAAIASGSAPNAATSQWR